MEQGRIKKFLIILLATFFIVSLTAVTAIAPGGGFGRGSHHTNQHNIIDAGIAGAVYGNDITTHFLTPQELAERGIYGPDYYSPTVNRHPGEPWRDINFDQVSGASGDNPNPGSGNPSSNPGANA